MPEIRGITLSVGYGDLLAITLPRNLRHLTECWVVTSAEDEKTQEVVCSLPNTRLFVTDAMHRHASRMNKGLCFEECWDTMGRHGLMWIWDADILFPPEVPFHLLQPNKLHGATRRVLEDPAKWSEELDWKTCPTNRDGGPIGHTQLFAADDPSIRDKRPWYDVSFTHAGGGDAYFMEHWSPANRVVLPFDVLHIGKTDMNWFGCDQEGQDMMAKFCRDNGWRAASRKHTAESAARAGPIVDRVEVPGYEPSSYELPFVRRAKRNQSH